MESEVEYFVHVVLSYPIYGAIQTVDLVLTNGSGERARKMGNERLGRRIGALCRQDCDDLPRDAVHIPRRAEMRAAIRHRPNRGLEFHTNVISDRQLAPRGRVLVCPSHCLFFPPRTRR